MKVIERLKTILEITEREINDSSEIFSDEEMIELLEYKKDCIDSIIFWAKAEINEEEREMRLMWEGQTLFEFIANKINNRIDECYQNEAE
jgi:hypothetical protein